MAKALRKEENRGNTPEQDAVLEEARALVARASLLLKNKGPKYAQVAWLLEDTISYIDETEVENDDVPVEGIDPRVLRFER